MSTIRSFHVLCSRLDRLLRNSGFKTGWPAQKEACAGQPRCSLESVQWIGWFRPDGARCFARTVDVIC
jgi:hypothetical protein